MDKKPTKVFLDDTVPYYSRIEYDEMEEVLKTEIKELKEGILMQEINLDFLRGVRDKLRAENLRLREALEKILELQKNQAVSVHALRHDFEIFDVCNETLRGLAKALEEDGSNRQ